MIVCSANSGDLDHTPCFAASDLCLHCLPMSHKKTTGLYGFPDLCTLAFLQSDISEIIIHNVGPYDAALRNCLIQNYTICP